MDKAPKGKSQSPCPENKIWDSISRKCINKTIFRKFFGEEKARKLSAEQKKLREKRKTIKKANGKKASTTGKRGDKKISEYKLFINIVDDDKFNFAFLYDEAKVTILENGGTSYSNAIPKGGWIGYIPTKGTDQLIKLIKEAHKKGLLYLNSREPLICCSVDIRKSKNHWNNSTISTLVEDLKNLLK